MLGEAKLIAIAVGIVAVLGAFEAFRLHERAIGADTVNAAVATQHAKDVDSARAKDAQINAAQEAADHEADNFRLAAALDARDVGTSAQRVQQRFAAVNACSVPNHSAASSPGPSASQPDPRADAFRLVVEAARRLAADADAEHAAGQLAEQRYDALTP